MSPAALNLLAQAYKNYIQRQSIPFSYLAANGADFFNSIEGARELHQDGYIKDVSDFVFQDEIDLLSCNLICFQITAKGIEYMRVNGEF